MRSFKVPITHIYLPVYSGLFALMRFISIVIDDVSFIGFILLFCHKKYLVDYLCLFNIWFVQ